MGLIRSGNTGLTPEEDGKLTGYLAHCPGDNQNRNREPPESCGGGDLHSL
ncbi:MAG: hypothetical protein V8R91_11165 [Butyricimonas faecihominis]